MKRTISIAKGKGSIGHNNRDFKAENVDVERVKYNTCFINENIKEVYQKLFGEALEKYNAKQKRNDRKIANYYEHIRLAKDKKTSYEIIVQVGDFEDMNAKTENGKIAEEILKQYMAGFQKRNHSLYVFSAHLHMDEATPHLHIDFIPYTSGNKRGLETQNTLKQALGKLGFNGGSRSSTELNQWQDAEKEVVAKIMFERGIEWEKKGGGKKHLTIENYKAEQRALEVAELENTIQSKAVIAEKLEIKNNDLQEVIQERQQEVNVLINLEHDKKYEVENLNYTLDKIDSSIFEKTEQLEEVETELNAILKDKKTIELNVYKFKEDKEWQLEEPSLLMSAHSYKEKKALPLVEKLKEYIQQLVMAYIKLRNEFERAKTEIRSLKIDVNRFEKIAGERLIGSDRYNILEKIIGKTKVDELIADYQTNKKQEVEQQKVFSRAKAQNKKTSKKRDYER